MAHSCHANGCNKPCRPELLMCPAHWRMVPEDVQRAVYAHYRHGQCVDMRPSQEWFNAAQEAIACVADAENKPMSRRQREFLRQRETGQNLYTSAATCAENEEK